MRADDLASNSCCSVGEQVMPKHVCGPANTCVACQQRKPCLMFEVTPPDEVRAVSRIIVCIDCAKDPIIQQTIVTCLVEDLA